MAAVAQGPAGCDERTCRRGVAGDGPGVAGGRFVARRRGGLSRPGQAASFAPRSGFAGRRPGRSFQPFFVRAHRFLRGVSSRIRFPRPSGAEGRSHHGRSIPFRARWRASPAAVPRPRGRAVRAGGPVRARGRHRGPRAGRPASLHPAVLRAPGSGNPLPDRVHAGDHALRRGGPRRRRQPGAHLRGPGAVHAADPRVPRHRLRPARRPAAVPAQCRDDRGPGADRSRELHREHPPPHGRPGHVADVEGHVRARDGLPLGAHHLEPTPTSRTRSPTSSR